MSIDAEPPFMQIAQQDYDAQIADAIERVKIQASIADRAMQSLMFTNGGALVALFTFVGHAPGIHFDVAQLKMAFGSFAVGLTLALVAHLLAFVSQDRYFKTSMLEARRNQRTLRNRAEDKDQAQALLSFDQGRVSYFIGLIVFVMSTVAFIVGCGLALWAVA